MPEKLDGPRNTLYRYKVDPYESIRPVHCCNYPYLWLLYLSKDRVALTELPA